MFSLENQMLFRSPNTKACQAGFWNAGNWFGHRSVWYHPLCINFKSIQISPYWSIMVKLFWFCQQCKKIICDRQHLKQRLACNFLMSLGDADNFPLLLFFYIPFFYIPKMFALLLCCRQLSISQCFIQSSDDKISNLPPKALNKFSTKIPGPFPFFKAVPASSTVVSPGSETYCSSDDSGISLIR